MQKLFTAVKYLTIWRNFTAVQATPAALGASMIYFPVIGLALGLVLALINYLLAPYLAPEILSMHSDYRPGRPDWRQPPHRAQK